MILSKEQLDKARVAFSFGGRALKVAEEAGELVQALNKYFAFNVEKSDSVFPTVTEEYHHAKIYEEIVGLRIVLESLEEKMVLLHECQKWGIEQRQIARFDKALRQALENSDRSSERFRKAIWKNGVDI